jgi:hypothetical protein
LANQHPRDGEALAKSAQVRNLLPARLGAVVLLALGAAALGVCGTPAAIKPVATPLPGFQRDIQDAKRVVAQTEFQAHSDASSGGGPP